MEGFGPPTIQMRFTGENTVIRNQTLSIINSSGYSHTMCFKYQIFKLYFKSFPINERTNVWFCILCVQKIKLNKYFSYALIPV